MASPVLKSSLQEEELRLAEEFWQAPGYSARFLHLAAGGGCG